MQLGLFEIPADVRIEPKMLTVRQPWAWAIFHAGKNVENRAWPVSYRGPLLICAGRRQDPAGYAFLEALGIEVPDLSDELGVIAGLVQIEDCVKDSGSPWARPGEWNWVLTGAKAATTRTGCTGSLGLSAAPAGWQHAL